MREEIAGYEKIIAMMPEGWAEKARELGALKRSRKIGTAADLLKLNLLYLTSGESFGGTSAMLKLAEGFSLNKNAVYERICKSADWIEWVCVNFCRESGFITEKPKWLETRRVRLSDATDEALKGSSGADYRLHCMVDLFTLETVETTLTTAKRGESMTNFNKIESGDIIIADRAYGTLTSINYILSKGGDFCVRLRANPFNLYDETGCKIDLSDLLLSIPENGHDGFHLQYKDHDALKPIFIAAYKKDSAQQERSLRSVKKSNRKKMRGKVSETQAFYNKFVVVATSLNETPKRIMELYRMRWQIELLFKRFKSLFAYDKIPSHKEQTAKAWFYGKLLLAAICESLVNQGRFSPKKQGFDEGHIDLE
jgi:hypothetical protein